MSSVPPPTAPAKIPMKMPAVIASKVAVLFSGNAHLPFAPMPINVKMSMKSSDSVLLSPSVSPSPQPRNPTAQSSPSPAAACKLEKTIKDADTNAPNQIVQPENNYSTKNECKHNEDVDDDENALLGITSNRNVSTNEKSVKVEEMSNDLELTEIGRKSHEETSNASFSSSSFSASSSSSSEMSLSRSSSTISSKASYSSSASSQSSYSSSASSSFSNEDDIGARSKKKNDKSSAMSGFKSTRQKETEKKTRKVRTSRKNGSDSNTDILSSISPEVNQGKRRRQVRTKGKRKSKSKRQTRQRNDDGSDEENNGGPNVEDSESSADEVDEFGNRVADKENAQNAMWFAMTDVSTPEDLIALATREGLICSKDEQSANNEKEDSKNEMDASTMVVTVNPPRPPVIRSFPSDIDAAITKYKERLNREENAVKMKDDTKAVSLGTSKINYIDPRIVCS